MSDGREVPTLFGGGEGGPLAARMRPTTLDEFLGQEHLTGPGKPLRVAMESGEVGSMVLWGPPGSGKTTLARLIAKHSKKQFVSFSAVTDGVPRVREIIAEARARRDYEGRGTLLFCDEIHRFNKAQQDAFLPWVEEGMVTLIGATTENPSFEINAALLSRLQVFVLHPLAPDQLRRIVSRALDTVASAGPGVTLAEATVDLLVRHADGDARKALNAVEAVVEFERARRSDGRAGDVTPEDLQAVLSRRMPVYDKGGEAHYNLISALHKAVRGSHVEGALYWLARMLEAGEDPLYVARRVVRMAAEDIGLADPRALSVALAATEAYRFLGSPEGDLALAEAVVYLASSPKSNRVYEAWQAAVDAARAYPNEPVPMHLRNAPTGLMRELGYGAGYRYDHAEGGHAEGQEYLPEALRDATWYRPTNAGDESIVAERLRRSP